MDRRSAWSSARTIGSSAPKGSSSRMALRIEHQRSGHQAHAQLLGRPSAGPGNRSSTVAEVGQLGELRQPVVDLTRFSSRGSGPSRSRCRGVGVQVRCAAAVLDHVAEPVAQSPSTVARRWLGARDRDGPPRQVAPTRSSSRSSVDLPQPLGPIKAVVRPAAMVRSISWRTTEPGHTT